MNEPINKSDIKLSDRALEAAADTVYHNYPWMNINRRTAKEIARTIITDYKLTEHYYDNR